MVSAFQSSQPVSTPTPVANPSISQPAPGITDAPLPIPATPHMEMAYSILAFTILIKVVLGAYQSPSK